jgi:hypothetical protein
MTFPCLRDNKVTLFMFKVSYYGYKKKKLEGVGGGVMWRMLLFSQQMFCKGCVF